MPLTFTLTAASSALNLATTTACQLIPLVNGKDAQTGSPELGHQIMSVDVVSDNSAEAGKLVILWVDTSQATDIKFRYAEATVTASAYRSASAGSTGGYICTVSFTAGANADLSNKVDLNGLAGMSTVVSSAGALGALSGTDIKCYVCCQTIVGTSWQVKLTPTRDN